MFPEGHHGQYFWISSSNGIWKWCIGPQKQFKWDSRDESWLMSTWGGLKRWEIKGIKLKEVYMVNF